MFESVKQARLQRQEIANLLKVNRVTVSMWLNGHTKPHHLLVDRVEKLIDAISAAVDAGDLPVPRDVSRRERGYYIQNALKKHLDGDITANLS